MRFTLKRGDLIRLEGKARGVTVRCESGVLWVTQKGQEQDGLLKAGGRLETQSRGRIVIWAFSDAVFLITDPAGRSLRPGLFGRWKVLPLRWPVPTRVRARRRERAVRVPDVLGLT